jgi:[protein-PII] uridylyltransferase
VTAILERVASQRRRRLPRRALKSDPAFDSDAVAERLAAIHATAGLAGVPHLDVVAVFRDALDTARTLVREAFEDTGEGLRCARHLSLIEDALIRTLFSYVVHYIHPAPAGGANQIVVAAVGGYGRGTLAPGSDIDLLFLLPGSNAAWSNKVIESILYTLWDLRQKVGHSTRSIEECVRYALEDMTVRTALLEARLILGDETLFEDMRVRFDREVVSNTPSEFVAAKLAERDARVVKAGRSRYLVEPNVKDGKGGLRDLNTLFWIAKYVYRVREASELVEAGLFSRKEYRLFCRCEEFLWRVRCHLHFVTGRAEERLTFDQQRLISERLGYVGRAGLYGVERFMKHYFLIAKEVGDLTAIVCAALEERQAKPSPMLDRFFGRIWRRRETVANKDFAIENARITVADPATFARDPVNLIRLFAIADESGLAIHPDAMRLVTLSLTRIDADMRNDPEANRLFLSIVSSRNSPEIVLRLMNQAGVLGRFIPDFGRIVALMQFNMYHSYTVDEHLVRAVGILADIESGRSVIEHKLAQEILPDLENRRVLYVALFLHDIAKGRIEDHSVAGVAVARKICPRLGLSAEETESVAWLIENHLVMSDTAQRRDLSDRRTIETFSALVGTLDRLNMLFILTVCDIRAVGPGVWNGWKAELLRTLYRETESAIGGENSTVARERRVTEAREELRAALPNWTMHDFDAYAARHPAPYWLKVDLTHKIRHANLLNMSEVESPGPNVDVLTDEARGITELTVIAPDHPRLLSTIAGACAAAAADIVDAQIFTTTDGLAVDMIYVTRALGRDEDELRRAGRIALAIERALKGEIRLSEMVAARGHSDAPAAETFEVTPEVVIDNALSGRMTVIEVAGLDRRGLLFELTAILSQLELNIGSAHIATFGEKAADVFYVTDLDGEKITDAVRRDTIRDALLSAFASPATRLLDGQGQHRGEGL